VAQTARGEIRHPRHRCTRKAGAGGIRFQADTCDGRRDRFRSRGVRPHEPARRRSRTRIHDGIRRRRV
jgi:hypothetical protein